MLAPVAINEREDIKRKSYHTDADEIANFNRPLIDGMDILTKLKPDRRAAVLAAAKLASRAGWPMINASCMKTG